MGDVDRVAMLNLLSQTLRERMGRKVSPLVAVFESHSLEIDKNERQSRQSGELTPALSSRLAHRAQSDA